MASPLTRTQERGGSIHGSTHTHTQRRRIPSHQGGARRTQTQEFLLSSPEGRGRRHRHEQAPVSMWGNRSPQPCCEECQVMLLLWKSSAVPRIIQLQLPFDPAIPHLGIYPGEMKTDTTYTQISIAALFIIDKRWTQPKCPTADE